MTPVTSTSVHYQTVLTLQTRPKSLQRFTMQVQDAVRESRVRTGLCCLFVRHTSASLVIQENADPDVLVDMENFLAKLVPEGNFYHHSAEGPDDMPAHWGPGKGSICGNTVAMAIAVMLWFILPVKPRVGMAYRVMRKVNS